MKKLLKALACIIILAIIVIGLYISLAICLDLLQNRAYTLNIF
jgi:hypothetical protein